MPRWPSSLTLQQRFLRFVHHEPNSGCWLWAGALENGYGKIFLDGRLRKAHRVSLFLETGEMPTGHVHHKCRQRHCVNPDHLQELNPSEHSSLHGYDHYRGVCDQGHCIEGTNAIRDGGRFKCRKCHNRRSNASMKRWRERNPEVNRERIKACVLKRKAASA